MPERGGSVERGRDPNVGVPAFSLPYPPECVEGDLKAPIHGQALQSGFCVPGPLRKVFSIGSRVINEVVLGACLVKVRVRLVSYALSYEKAVSDLSEVDEPDRLAGARPQRPPRRFYPLEGGSDPPCWRPHLSHDLTFIRVGPSSWHPEAQSRA